MFTTINPHWFIETHDSQTGMELPAISPFWKEHDLIELTVFLSASSQREKEESVVLDSTRFNLGLESSIMMEYNLTRDILGVLLDRLEQDQALLIDFVLENQALLGEKYSTLSIRNTLTRRLDVKEKTEKRQRLRYLAKDWPYLRDFVPQEKNFLEGVPASGDYSKNLFWKPKIKLSIVDDYTRWPLTGTPSTLLHVLKLTNGKRMSRAKDTKAKYIPLLFSPKDSIQRELIQVNDTLNLDSGYNTLGYLPLSVSIEHVSLSNYLFYNFIVSSIEQQKGFGLSDSDLAEIEEIYFGTDFTLLLITLVISLLHIVFDYLAFYSDIDHWKKTSSLVGISISKEIMNLAFSAIIFSYLYISSTSFLVLISQAFTITVQFWKIFRILQLQTSANDESMSAELELTRQIDNQYTFMMLRYLSPIAVAYTGYNFVYFKYVNYFYWTMESLVSIVYILGFIKMIPQLILNYKLKTVKYISYNYLFYQFLNTFIDDLFALIVTMPDISRYACFRDDIIFVIYLYQRYLYKSDVQRES